MSAAILLNSLYAFMAWRKKPLPYTINSCLNKTQMTRDVHIKRKNMLKSCLKNVFCSSISRKVIIRDLSDHFQYKGFYDL
jgi:hypothetical protein